MMRKLGEHFHARAALVTAFIATVVVCGACAEGLSNAECGNGLCESSESAATCPEDCSTGGTDSGTATCGDAICDPSESCASCEGDCGMCPSECGDFICSPAEDCMTCSIDCGVCNNCGDGTCEGGEDCTTCSADCGPCSPMCGDGTCDPGEDCASCASDCGPCGPVCGDGTCDSGEDCASCASDCGPCGPMCGDGTCDPGEDCTSCASDCGPCGTGSCTPASTWAAPSCGVADNGSTSGGGATDMTDTWTGCFTYDTTGPEYAYQWTAPGSGPVTLTLSNLGENDLDLFVFADTGGGCALGSMTCVDHSQNGCFCFIVCDCDDETITFTATSGTTYYFIVDGYDGAMGSYTLTMSGCSF